MAAHALDRQLAQITVTATSCINTLHAIDHTGQGFFTRSESPAKPKYDEPKPILDAFREMMGTIYTEIGTLNSLVSGVGYLAQHFNSLLQHELELRKEILDNTVKTAKRRTDVLRNRIEEFKEICDGIDQLGKQSLVKFPEAEVYLLVLKSDIDQLTAITAPWANPDRIARMADSTALAKVVQIQKMASDCIEKLEAAGELAKKLTVRAHTIVDPRTPIRVEIAKATSSLNCVLRQFKYYEEHPSEFEEQRTSAEHVLLGSLRQVVPLDDIQEAIAFFRDSEDASKENWQKQISLIERMKELLKIARSELKQLEELRESLQ